MARQRFLWHAALILTLATPDDGRTQPVSGATRAGSDIRVRASIPSRPGSAIASIYRAIETGNTERLATLLTNDFLFTSNDPGFIDAFPHGFDRDAELDFVHKMKAAGDRAAIQYDGYTVDPLPSAVATGIFLVRAKGATMRIVQHNGATITAGPSEHVFEIVCVPDPATVWSSEFAMLRTTLA